MIDLSRFPCVDLAEIQWLRREGVSANTIAKVLPIRIARGHKAPDGIFEDDPDGPYWFVLEQSDDVIYWRPGSSDIATELNRAFALGEDTIDNPGTYAFDCSLNLWPDPLHWLKAGCDGCVILDWSRAWSRLQHVPRIAVHESLLFQYRRHMQPPPCPETYVIHRGIAA